MSFTSWTFIFLGLDPSGKWKVLICLFWPIHSGSELARFTGSSFVPGECVFPKMTPTVSSVCVPGWKVISCNVVMLGRSVSEGKRHLSEERASARLKDVQCDRSSRERSHNRFARMEEALYQTAQLENSWGSLVIAFLRFDSLSAGTFQSHSPLYLFTHGGDPV